MLNLRRSRLCAALLAAISITCVASTQNDKAGIPAIGNTLYDQCATEDSTYTQGSCMLEQECDYIGGTASGTCAEGLGACCIVKMSCNQETTLNNTYFVKPANNDPLQEACALTVNRANEDICQIRLEFLELQLSQPDDDGHCSGDFLAVTGEMTTGIPAICGSNDGQHIYVDVEPNGGALDVIVDLLTPATASRDWKIQIQQIACDSKYRAPDGCLQYYTETSGTVKSFNFNDYSEEPGTRQIADHNYGICIKKHAGYCSIIWERDPEILYSFTVSESVEASPEELIGTPAACSTGADMCYNDYVIIPGGVTDEMEQADRYCGLGFPNLVTSTSTPFVLHVKTDHDEQTDESNYGFQLIYRQTTTC